MTVVYKSRTTTGVVLDFRVLSEFAEPAVDIKKYMRTFQNHMYVNAVSLAPKGNTGHLADSHKRQGLLKRGAFNFETGVANDAIYARTIHNGRPTLTQANLKNATKWATPVLAPPPVVGYPVPARRGDASPNWRRNAQAAEVARGRIIRGGRNPHVVAMVATRGQHAGNWIWLSDTLPAVPAQPWLEDAADWARQQMRGYQG